MSSGKKRNFTTQERNLLLDILNNYYKHVIRNKKTDHINAQLKKRAWAEIADRYNTSSIVTVSATGDQLRRLWFNLKTRKRDALTKELQHRLITGGGSPCPDADIDQKNGEVASALLFEITDSNDSDFLENNSAEIKLEESKSDIMHSELLHRDPVLSVAPSELLRRSAVLPSAPLQLPHISAVPTSTSTTGTNNRNGTKNYLSKEKKLRIQILKREHLSRERRAEELHRIEKKHLEDKYTIELDILKEEFKEAKAKAELAQKELHK